MDFLLFPLYNLTSSIRGGIRRCWTRSSWLQDTLVDECYSSHSPDSGENQMGHFVTKQLLVPPLSWAFLLQGKVMEGRRNVDWNQLAVTFFVYPTLVPTELDV